MFEIERDDDFPLERQWSLLEEHRVNGKPIVARILEITKGRMVVDVGGIQGYVEQFTFGLTWSRSPEALEEMQQSSIEQLAQQRLMDMRGKEILLRVVEVDKKSRHLKLSQRLRANNKPVSEELEIGSVHTAIITSISAAFVTVDLGGIRGKLPSKQPSPDQSKFIDLSTMLRIGQEIKVVIIQKEKNVYFLSLKEF